MTLALPINHVPLDRPKGAFKPCMWCGGESATFEEAPLVEPARHSARVKCESCGRQIAWASASQVRKALRSTGVDAMAQRYIEHVIPFERKQISRGMQA